MNVLVVDDSSTMRRIVRNYLRGIGYTEVMEAENGASAFEQLSKQPAGLVITDWNMPVMDGLELVSRIRGAASLKHVPVLMVTTVAEKEQIVRAIQAGITNYMVKPFDGETLRQKIEQVLAAKGA